MRTALIRHPRVLAMADTLAVDDRFIAWLVGEGYGHQINRLAIRYIVVGGLLEWWGTARAAGSPLHYEDKLLLESRDCERSKARLSASRDMKTTQSDALASASRDMSDWLKMSQTTRARIDESSGVPGFADALESAGWIIIIDDETTVFFREFADQNGVGRSSTSNAERCRRYRMRKKAAEANSTTKSTPTKRVARHKTDARRDMHKKEREKEKREKDHALIDDEADSGMLLDVGNARRDAWSERDIERIRTAYPRRVAKQAAQRAIRAALRRIRDDGHTDPIGYLLEATTSFSQATDTWPENERQYIPYPATWFNGGRYDDDRSQWRRSGDGQRQPPRLSDKL